MHDIGPSAAFAAATSFAVAIGATSLAAAQSVSPLLNSPPTLASVPIGPTHAYSVAVAPGTHCSIHPQGVTNDPSRSAAVIAHDDGKVRFDIAPSAATAWGTLLTLDCIANGASDVGANGVSQSYQVDLNDSSTFTWESATDLQPVKTGVRPPLTGNLTAIPTSQLLQGSYLLPPDPSSSLYPYWVQAVSKSVDIYRAIPVTILGQHNYGSYVGGDTWVDQTWSGVVQSANGFSNIPYVNQGSTLYTAYEAIMHAPDPQGCWYQSCDSSSFWAGTGGTWVNVNPTYNSALLQNGFQFDSGAGLSLFAEFAPGPIDEFQAVHTMNPGDAMFIEGVDTDATCSNHVTNQPAAGCFLWEDLSQNDWVEIAIEQYPTGTPWYPASMEYISEWHPAGAPGGGVNDNVGDESIFGTAMDTTVIGTLTRVPQTRPIRT